MSARNSLFIFIAGIIFGQLLGPFTTLLWIFVDLVNSWCYIPGVC